MSPGTGCVEFEYPTPNLREHAWPTLSACDDFEAGTLDLCWNSLRTPRESSWSLSELPGFLRLRLRPQMLSDCANSSFVGRPQQHLDFAAHAAMDFAPASANECARIALLQNNDYHFRFVVAGTERGEGVVRPIKREAGEQSSLAEQPIGEGRVYLKLEAHGQDYSLYVGSNPETW